MDRLIQVDRERLTSEMHQELEGMLGQVMDAVNAAKDGRLIEDSERPMLELMRNFQKRFFEKALQLRVDSTESAFSPSKGPKTIHLCCKSNGVMILRRKPHAQAWRIGILGKGRGLAAGVSMAPTFPQGLTR